MIDISNLSLIRALPCIPGWLDHMLDRSQHGPWCQHYLSEKVMGIRIVLDLQE
jgi:hypothetical protein